MNLKPLFFLCITFVWGGKTGISQIIDHWETVVFAEDIWHYQPGTTEPPADWMQSNFDDSNWAIGPGGFGYGDGDDMTIIAPTLSLYIRIDFELFDTSKIEKALLHADYDDAFVAYFNGVEFARGNFGAPGTPPAFDEIPPTDHEAALYQGGVPEVYSLNSAQFKALAKEGGNTLAIQIHNFLITSSDLTSNFFFSLGIKDSSSDYAPTPDWFYEPFASSNLPIIKINTNEQTIEDEPKIVADMEVIDNGPGNRNYLTDPPNDYNGRIAIEIRGASSQSFPKKNYSFETQDELGENNNYPLLGLPEENDWILHGPYSDKSLIRNALSFDISRKMMDYASRTRFCELLINDDYRGVYLLMERIKRDTSRVDIARLRPEDIEGDELSGGYIFQLDRDDESTEEDGWYSPFGSNPFYAFHHPEYDDLLEIQKDYLISWMNEFEAAMNASNYAQTYEQYIDVPSFVDYFLINELTKHVDAFKLSFYMYKRKDSNGGKLHMGPVWDFNLGFSNFTFECPPEPEGWIYPCTSRAFWLDKLLEVPDVRQAVYCRWLELREDILHTDNLLNTIDNMVDTLAEAQVRNFARWNIMGVEIWPNYFVGSSYEEETDFLKDWLIDRIDWMDENMLGIGSVCLSHTEAILNNPSSLEISPNPFNQQTSFYLKSDHLLSGKVTIYNIQGKILDQFVIAPNQALQWNNVSLNSGVYFYQLEIPGRITERGKLIRQ